MPTHHEPPGSIEAKFKGRLLRAVAFGFSGPNLTLAVKVKPPNCLLAGGSVSELLEIPRKDDPRYPKSVACHEAGHAVVAAAQGLRLSRHGIHLAADGNGIAYYEHREPGPIAPAPALSHLKREPTIVCCYAGLIAQRKFHRRCSGCAAVDDENTADLLLAELVKEDLNPFGFLTSTAQIELGKIAKELVDPHWPAIEAIAREFWETKPVEPALDDPAPGWPTSGLERRISGARIIEILRPFADLHPSLWDAKP
jgi:hypothetical protein